MSYSLSAEEIKSLVELERQMDSGEIPYIYIEGCRQRASMQKEHMVILGLKVGQTVSHQLWIHILEFKLEELKREMAHQQVEEILNDDDGIKL